MSDSDPFDEDYVADEAEADPEDEGYTTGFSSGEDDDNENYFGDDLDLDGLLHNMAQPQAGDGQLQPYQILRQQRNQQGRPKGAKGARRRQGAAAGDGSGTDQEGQEGKPVELTSTSEPKRKKKKPSNGGGGRRGPRQMELPEHISRMVGHANLLYASNKYQQAVDILLEVIRQVPNLSDPYHTLGALHEVMGDMKQALNFFMIAAHMSGKDVLLWQKLAEMSTEQGFIRQAIYCWNKVIAKDKDNFEARFKRAQLYNFINEPWRAKEQYTRMLDQHPGHPEVIKALVQLLHEYHQSERAIVLLEDHLAKHFANVDLTHINMLADLYMGIGHYNNVIQLINRSEQVMCTQDPLPIDLRVRRGASYAHMGDAVAAIADLSELLKWPVVDDETGDDYQDLYMLALQEMGSVGMHAQALPFVDRLRDAPSVLELPEQCYMLAECYVRAGRRDHAIALYTHKLSSMGLDDVRYMNAALTLAALHLGGQDAAAAEAVLAAIDEAIAAHQLTLPEGQTQQLELFLHKASLQLQLGHKQAFAASLTPHITNLLEQMENNGAILAAATKAQNSGAVPKELVKALKRRKMYARKGGRKGKGGGEVASVFRGYVSRDRRKPHIVKADEAAERLLRRARMSGAVSGAEDTEAEPSDDDDAAAADGDLPTELQALVAAAAADQEDTPDLFSNQPLYSCFVDLVHVLLDIGQEDKAANLLARAQAVSAYCMSYRDPSWIGPSALKQPSKAKRKSKASAADGNLSDWGPDTQAAAATTATAERREQVRVLREGLRLLAAEIAFRQGNVEETIKLLKSVLPKWPNSWQAWSLYCSCAGQLGRVQHWMKSVAALRAKYPDSLPLQVLAAHADNMSGEAGYAIQSYASALLRLPNEPLLLLCLGAAQIDAALTTRHMKDRNTALLRGFAALHTYAKHRAPEAEAEAAYNLGRAAHEVGLLHVAVAHYERVLQLAHQAEAEEAVQQLRGLSMQAQQQQQQDMQLDGQQDHSQQQQQQAQNGMKGTGNKSSTVSEKLQRLSRGLVREAAHNLCMIYRGSGADDLAKQIMRRYLTI